MNEGLIIRNRAFDHHESRNSFAHFLVCFFIHRFLESLSLAFFVSFFRELHTKDGGLFGNDVNVGLDFCLALNAKTLEITGLSGFYIKSLEIIGFSGLHTKSRNCRVFRLSYKNLRNCRVFRLSYKVLRNYRVFRF